METFGADKVSMFKYCSNMLEQELTSDNTKLYLVLWRILKKSVKWKGCTFVEGMFKDL